MNNLIEELIALLSIESETGKEEEISNYIFQYFKKHETIESFRINNSVLFFSKQDPSKENIALYGHLDTVHNQQDKPVHIDKDFIFGCGASDMKGGLAIMIKLLEKHTKNSSPYNLACIFYDKEEGPYEENGLGPILEAYPRLQDCQLAFALEPTNNQLQIGCVGGLHAKVRFHGKSSHSARPWEGENAIHKSWKLLKKLEQLKRKPENFENLTFYNVINATIAQGGKTRNSIPNLFEINLNYRFSPSKSIEIATQELLEFIGPEPEIEIVDRAPSGPVFLDNPILKDFMNLHQLQPVAKQAWTDVARLALYDIPAVNFGPGDTAQAHQKNEMISVMELEKGFRMLDQFIFYKK